mgnify:CR=1 FL=1
MDFMPLNGMSAEAKKVMDETQALGEGEGDLQASIKFSKDIEGKKGNANIGDGKDYSGEILIEEVQNKREFNIFVFITVLTAAFGLLVILFLKRLKALTHGAEEITSEEQ